MRVIRRRLAPFLCGALALGGCSGPGVLNALTPSSGYRVVRDIPYGEGPRRTLDLYVPEGVAAPAPTIVFFYGGSWQEGTKNDFVFVGQALASRGYQVAIPDYRLYPEVAFPEFVANSAAAVAWVKRNAGKAGLEAGTLFLAGHSAGAYNAVMLAVDERWLERSGVARSEIAAVAGLAGPYDFLPIRRPDIKAVFGPEEQRERTQPINHVDGGAPPMLLMAGADDDTVRPRNSFSLAEKLRAAGDEAKVVVYENVGHLSLIAALAKPLRFLAPALDDIDTFFKGMMRRS